MKSFKLHKGNSSFSLCACYPTDLLIPSSIPDDTIEKAAKSRVGGKLPGGEIQLSILIYVVLTYRSNANGHLYRSGSPVSLHSSQSLNRSEDVKLVDSLSPYPMVTYLSSSLDWVKERLRIYDTGSVQQWMQTTYPKAEISFVGLGGLNGT